MGDVALGIPPRGDPSREHAGEDQAGDDGLVAITGGFRLVPASAPPVACAAGTAGTVYYDSDINEPCMCNATNYVLMKDMSTTTGCS
jgi:hypothetical protein